MLDQHFDPTVPFHVTLSTQNVPVSRPSFRRFNDQEGVTEVPLLHGFGWSILTTNLSIGDEDRAEL